MFIPSKKIIFLLIACIFSVSLLFFANKITQKNNPVDLAIIEATGTQADSSDGSDTSTNSDELIQKINELNASTTATGKTGSSTLTDTFAKDLFSQYLQTQSGGATDDQTNQVLSDSILNKYSDALNTQDYFDSSDIKTSSSLDNEKIKQYANDFLTIEDRGVREANALSKDDEISMIPMGKRYQQLASDLGNLTVPEALEETHLAIMNSYYHLGEMLVQIPTTNKDPFKKLLLLQKIPENQTERQQFYQNIESFIKNSGIIFSNDEPGRYWLVSAQ